MIVFALIAPLHGSHVLTWIWLYIGPDVFLPLTSALAAIAGVLLMFWHRIVGFVGRLFGRRPANPAKPEPPLPGKKD
jgi:hypothetical protein